MREQLVKMRTMQINQLRGILYEFGANLPQGRRKGIAKVGEELAQLEDKLSTMVIETIRKQLHRIEELNKDIAEIEKRLQLWKADDDACQKIIEILELEFLPRRRLWQRWVTPKHSKAAVSLRRSLVLCPGRVAPVAA
jgi:transposase